MSNQSVYTVPRYVLRIQITFKQSWLMSLFLTFSRIFKGHLLFLEVTMELGKYGNSQ